MAKRLISSSLNFLGTVLLAATFVAACGSGDDSLALNDAGSSTGGRGSNGAGGTTAGTGGSQGIPPEEELEGEYRAPVASGRFLWSANPTSNRVALVDAKSLEVTTLDGGHGPTHLVALPPQDARTAGAAVINVLGDNATFYSLPSGDAAATRANVSSVTVPLYGPANAWEVGVTGAFAIAWTRARDVAGADPIEGFQDVTVIDRRGKTPVATRLSVGYRPSQVFVAANERYAFVVSEPGISVIELTAKGGPRVTRELFLPEAAAGAPRDVSFVPSGELAFLRTNGKSELLVVSTLTDERSTVTLPAPVTDFDITEDGERAVAVMRRPSDGSSGGDSSGAAGAGGSGKEPSRVAWFEIDTAGGTLDQLDVYELDGLFGSATLSPDGQRALLYTNATDSSTLSILELASGAHRELDLKAPVRGVFITPDGENAVALLSPPAGSAKSGAFALVPVDKALPPRIQGTDAPAFLVALSESSTRALVTTKDPTADKSAVYLARFPELSVDRTPLPSRPLAAGIVTDAAMGFVAGDHAEGRVTFVDLAKGSARTLTGFELGAKVIEGR